MKSLVRASIGLAVLASFACRQQNLEEEVGSAPAPPPAAAIAPVRSNTPLDEKLSRLDAELTAVIESNFGDDMEERLQRAEAITDRLLETEPPYTWLASQYSSEARLRQLQALADRVMARVIRDDVDMRALRGDVRHLQALVARLRGDLAVPGGSAPVPLDSLLAEAPSRPVPAGTDGREERAVEPEPTGPALLGVPLDTLSDE